MSEYNNDNIFAKILREEMPCFKVYEDENTLAFMDVMPLGKGHCLVITKEPARNILDISPEALSAVHRVAQKVAKASMKVFGADGIALQQFTEAEAGQTVFHLHVHIIPCFKGVNMSPPGVMGDMDMIKANSELLAAAME